MPHRATIQFFHQYQHRTPLDVGLTHIHYLCPVGNRLSYIIIDNALIII